MSTGVWCGVAAVSFTATGGTFGPVGFGVVGGDVGVGLGGAVVAGAATRGEVPGALTTVVVVAVVVVVVVVGGGAPGDVGAAAPVTTVVSGAAASCDGGAGWALGAPLAVAAGPTAPAKRLAPATTRAAVPATWPPASQGMPLRNGSSAT